MFKLVCVFLYVTSLAIADDCKPSITTASGKAATRPICSGALIFEENFDTLDKTKWQPLVTFWDGGVSFTFQIR